ncbi:NLR family CARD domain-containing protein 3-like [Cyprinodon tularosa]|uniref:NLR family CARD domain-containing protein 3-like n=1 Tax=Cyprinodon tularosa TaxID=77115 RepID=UPI0018E20ABC|nr:NLR family CARD domain-containing protein 3-like [Cyprinodon tularosa]
MDQQRPESSHHVSPEDKIQINEERPESHLPRGLSMTESKHEPLDFKDEGPSENKIQMDTKRLELSQPTSVSMSTEQSEDEPDEIVEQRPSVHEILSRMRPLSNKRPSRRSSGHENKSHLDLVFKVLEDDIMHFVTSELRKMKNMLSPESSGRYSENKEETADEEMHRKSNRYAFLKITINFLRRRNEERLAESLLNKAQTAVYQFKLKSHLVKKCQQFFEGNVKRGNPKSISQIYTQLYVAPDEREVKDEDDVQKIESASLVPGGSETTISCEDIFKPERDEKIRTLVTKGVSGIGKTVLTQKYTLDWAEGKANPNIQFIFPYTCRELNLLKSKSISLIGLIHQFFPETKEAEISCFEKFQVLFIFDGLDELQPPLTFSNAQILTDVSETASMHVVLANLIRGKLLPSALIWITTRPAAANQIPFQYVDSMTEVRGFTDLQKEEYFRKKYPDKERAKSIISHIFTSSSLQVMCRIPVFCWITATVLDEVMKDKGKTEPPKTLTELYIHFLVVQINRDNAKSHNKMLTELIWNSESEKILLTFGKLAFEQLERGNLIFYEEDLKEYDIDINTASAYTAVFRESFKEGSILNQKRMFGFVHQSIQEFLAALHVFLEFIKTSNNLLRRSLKPLQRENKFKQFYLSAVDKALGSPNGQWDMFTRFLLGLSLKNNQNHLQGLIKKTSQLPDVQQMLVQNIKQKIRVCPSSEESVRMFDWLNELNDHSLEEEMTLYLKEKGWAKKLTSSQWSALAYVLMYSQRNYIFNFKKFSDSKEALIWLQPVMKASKKSLLYSCKLSQRSCIPLGSMLAAETSCLRELDLSDNDLRDDGVEILSQGLMNKKCRLEVLSLSGCLVSERGCASLASALTCNPSHLRELDLSFNHPGESELRKIYAGMKDQGWRLQTLKTDHCGKLRLNPSPQRFFLEQKLDPNTANKNLLLSEDNKQAEMVEEKQPYADHPERFDTWKHVLCRDGLTGCCYWEVLGWCSQ